MREALPRTLSERADALARDREHGASWLGRFSLRAAADSVGTFGALDRARALAEMHQVIDSLIAARPEMAPVRYWLEQLRLRLAERAPEAGDGDEIRRLAAEIARDLEREAAQAAARAAEQGGLLLAGDEVVFTASYSATVAEACRFAGRAGRLRRVLLAESRLGDGPAYGQAMRRALRGSGLETRVVPDAEIERWMPGATSLVLGADAVLADASVINGYPSLEAARSARRLGRRVVVVCERAKFDRWHTPDDHPVPPGFQRIPGTLVDLYVTEAGPLHYGGAERPPKPEAGS